MTIYCYDTESGRHKRLVAVEHLAGPSDDILDSLSGGLVRYPEFEVLGPVVGLAPVLVMNRLAFGEASTQHVGHHMSVLEYPCSVVQADASVSGLREVVPSHAANTSPPSGRATPRSQFRAAPTKNLTSVAATHPSDACTVIAAIHRAFRTLRHLLMALPLVVRIADENPVARLRGLGILGAPRHRTFHIAILTRRPDL